MGKLNTRRRLAAPTTQRLERPAMAFTPSTLAFAAALACSSGLAMADNCATPPGSALTQGQCAPAMPPITKPATTGFTSFSGLYKDGATPTSPARIPGLNTNSVIAAGTQSLLYQSRGANIFNSTASRTVVLEGTEASRIFLAGQNNNLGTGILQFRDGAQAWAAYTDLQMASASGLRTTYSAAPNSVVVLDHLRADQSAVTGAGRGSQIGLVSEDAGRTYVMNSSLVMQGAAASGLWAWGGRGNRPALMEAIRSHVATVRDGAQIAYSFGGSTVTVEESQLYASGSQSVIARTTSSKIFLNGNVMAMGIALGNQRLTNSWNGAPPESAPTGFDQFSEKADWTTYGKPVDATGANVENQFTRYVATNASDSYAVLAETAGDQLRLDLSRSNKPNVIHMFGAQNNHALFVKDFGTITSRGTEIHTHSPGSAGARITNGGTLLVDGNSITTLADNAHGLWASGGGTLGTPYAGSTIVTEGANSHAVRADGGAQLRFDNTATPPTFAPASGSRVSGAGAAVWNADGSGTQIIAKGAVNSLALPMTADATGSTNFGVLAANGARVTLDDAVNTGGTALNASNSSTIAFVGTGSSGAGSRTLLTSGGTLDISTAAQPVAIGSLEGSGGGNVTLGTNTLQIVPGSGSSQSATIYSGNISGANGRLVFNGANASITLTQPGGASYTGATSVAAGSLIAGAAGVFAPSSAHGVSATATLDLNGFDQTVASLDNAGVVVLPQVSALPQSARIGVSKVAPGQPGVLLTTSGDYVSNGGTLVVGSTLNGDGSPSDRLIVNGNVVTGTGPTLVDVRNILGVGAGTSPNDGILVVQVTGNSPAGTFALQHTTQAGNYNYSLNQIGKNWYLQATLIAPQTITFPPPPDQSFVKDSTYALPVAPTASSNLPVTLVSTTPTVCTVSGTSIIMVSAGTCTLTASQPGDGTNWLAADDVTVSFALKAKTPEPSQAAPVPVLDKLGLLLMSVGLGSLGLWLSRRRQSGTGR